MMKVQEKIAKLRALMEENNMAAYIIPSADAHQSEYVAEHWKSREWLSGFTGSAGTVVVTLEEAGLWTDGRYYIQAENQLAGSGIRLFRMMDPEVPFYSEWLAEVLAPGSSVGFDGSLFSVDQVRRMEKDLKEKGIVYETSRDLIGELWDDRPEVPTNPLFIHGVKYAGKSRTEKLAEVRQEMREKGANYHLLTSLDDIAWLLNIRGSDVPNNPTVIANVLVSDETCYVFIDSQKVPLEVKQVLESEGLLFKEAYTLEAFLGELSSEDAVLLDSSRTNIRLYQAIPGKTKKVEAGNITTDLKGIKNKQEIHNLRQCELRDGVAMVRFIKWLKENVGKEKITEMSAEAKLEALRSQQDLFVGPSFDTIAGYKENAAMMHYKANPESDATLLKEGFFLVDSGGQYYDGTTDITRTIVLGPLTDEEKRHYTLVLQGFIALSAVKFLHGTTGANLDVLARQPIWQQGIDYKCGTGHGVGFFLNVHEGPQSIRNNMSPVVLEKGMIITNEPGIYIEGKHGIRTENMLVVDEAEKTSFGQFMAFETLTYCPIDLAGIKVEMLTTAEKDWLNGYHREVYGKLSPFLNEEEKVWLKAETQEI